MLFLDEFTEFRRDAIEGLRQPLEDGRVVVTRITGLYYELDSVLSAEDTAILQALVSVGTSQERLGFLGG